jgi:diguanylate cyclase (GGDEF)-like protein
MRRLLLLLTDWSIPLDLREFQQREDIERARVVCLILLLGFIVMAAITLLAHSTTVFPLALKSMLERAAPALGLTYAIALGIFRRTGRFRLTAHLYAGLSLIIYVIGLMLPPADIVPMLLIPLLAIPLFAAMIGGMTAGLPWIVALLAVPMAINVFSVEHLGNAPPISAFFIGVWAAPNISIAFALWCFEHITTHMRHRLDEENARFAFDAAHDSLTGLANRATFARRLGEAIEHARYNRQMLSLMYIDLNDFKPINDRYGHHAGDAVLIAVAHRLAAIVRQSDTVARLGGDEFVVLYAHLQAHCDLEHFVQRIHATIAEPVMLGETPLSVSASIGVVCYPEDGDDAATLQKRADALMYESKQRR